MIANSPYLSVLLECTEECVRVERSCWFGHLRTWLLMSIKNRPEIAAKMELSSRREKYYRNWDALIM